MYYRPDDFMYKIEYCYVHNSVLLCKINIHNAYETLSGETFLLTSGSLLFWASDLLSIQYTTMQDNTGQYMTLYKTQSFNIKHYWSCVNRIGTAALTELERSIQYI